MLSESEWIEYRTFWEFHTAAVDLAVAGAANSARNEQTLSSCAQHKCVVSCGSHRMCRTVVVLGLGHNN